VPAPGFTQDRLLALLTAAPEACWRHDVDQSPYAAWQMARFEAMAGVRAIFYVMVAGDYYNPFSQENTRILTEIQEMGHLLGLHVDYRPDSYWSPIRASRRDRALWDAGHPTLRVHTRVSFHMPCPEVLWADLPGLENAYAAKWLGRYASDSRGVLDPAFVPTNDMQVALHAEHWFGMNDPIGEDPPHASIA
jgi:hypothetical protein